MKFNEKKIEILSLILFLLIPLIITSFDFLNKYPSLLMQTEEVLVKPRIIISQKSSGNGWLPGGTPISMENNQRGFPQICSDGTGGAIITWRDDRSGSDYDIYAQHIEYDPTELEGGEIPFEIIIAIASFIGIAVVIGIATTLIIKKRRKIE